MNFGLLQTSKTSHNFLGFLEAERLVCAALLRYVFDFFVQYTNKVKLSILVINSTILREINEFRAS
jgi:hypothetical protein